MRLYAAVVLAVVASVVAAALLTWHENTIDHHRQASSAAFVHQLKQLCTAPSSRRHPGAAAQKLLALPLPPNTHAAVTALAHDWTAAASLKPGSKPYLQHASDAAKAAGDLNVDVCAKVLVGR